MAHRGRESADEALALAIAGGQTLRDAAASAGLSERTARRRWDDDAFRRRVAEMRGEMVNRALGQLADGSTEAAATLRSLLADGTPPAVRLGAARALLELGSKLRESVELANRVDELERLLNGGDHDLENPREPVAGSGQEATHHPAGQAENPTPNGPGMGNGR